MTRASDSTRESTRAGELLSAPVVVDATTLPPVSVVITGHERTSYLPEAVESVRSQNYPAPIEIIVVDDGSTVPLEETLAERCPGVRWIRQTNQGVCAARDRGLREARHEFVAHLDDDDLCHPDRLRIQAEFLVEHPEVDFVCCDMRHTYDPPDRPGCFTKNGIYRIDSLREQCPNPGEWIYPRNSMLQRMFIKVPFFPSMLMARKSSSIRIGGWDAAARRCGDCHDYFVRANHLGVIAFIERPLIIFRRGHDDHLTNDTPKYTKLEALQLHLLIEKYPRDLQQLVRPAFAQYLGRRANASYRQGRIDLASLFYRRAAIWAVGLGKRRIKWTIAATGLTILNALKRGKGTRAVESEFLDPIGGPTI